MSVATVEKVKSLAEDAIEDGAHAARRAVKSVRRDIASRQDDIKDESVHYVKRQPLKAIAMAAGLGLLVGVTAGWIAAFASRPADVASR